MDGAAIAARLGSCKLERPATDPDDRRFIVGTLGGLLACYPALCTMFHRSMGLFQLRSCLDLTALHVFANTRAVHITVMAQNEFVKSQQKLSSTRFLELIPKFRKKLCL